jgi:hypothetical protein
LQNPSQNVHILTNTKNRQNLSKLDLFYKIKFKLHFLQNTINNFQDLITLLENCFFTTLFAKKNLKLFTNKKNVKQLIFQDFTSLQNVTTLWKTITTLTKYENI